MLSRILAISIFFICCFNLAGYAQVSKDTVDVVTTADVMPQFPGGQDAMYEYIRTTTKYPEKEKRKNIQGTVYIQFIVGIHGSIEDVKVLRGIKNGKALEQEAVRVIKNMPLWEPGKVANKPTPVRMVLPLKFMLK